MLKQSPRQKKSGTKWPINSDLLMSFILWAIKVNSGIEGERISVSGRVRS